MAISFPTGLDNFTNPSSGNTLDSPSHSLQHSDLNDAVEALERKVGVGTAVAGSASAGQVLTISAAGTSTWSTPSQGLTLIKTETFSGVTSVNVNDVFSSTYDNYRIVLRFSSSTGSVSMRMRVSGTDTSSSDYSYIRGSAYSDTGPTWALAQSLSATSWASLNASDNASTSGYSIDIYGPNLATTTTLNAQTNGTESSVPIRIYTAVYSGVLRLTTQYTGFTIIGATALGLTGKASVYGYNL